MAGPGETRRGASLPGRAQPVTALSLPARLDEGAASQAALRVLELYGQAELDPGGEGSPEASHCPPTSSSTSARRPCCSPQRSFPSCPAAVPAPPRTGESCALPPRSCWTRPRARGRVGREGRAARFRKRRGGRGSRSLARARSRSCRQPAAAGEWGANQRLQEGGDWRRGLEAGQAAGSGWAEGCRAKDCGSQPSRDRPPPRHPHPFPPGLRAWESKGHRIWGSSRLCEGCLRERKGRCARGAGTLLERGHGGGPFF